MVGNLEGTVREGRGVKEEEWSDCVQSGVRTFDIIAGEWKVTALEAEVRCGLRRPRRVGGGFWPRGGNTR